MTSIENERAQKQRLLQWSIDVIRVWNWPLVTSGELSKEELDEEVQIRSSMLQSMDSATVALCMLHGMPDEIFFNA